MRIQKSEYMLSILGSMNGGIIRKESFLRRTLQLQFTGIVAPEKPVENQMLLPLAEIESIENARDDS